MQASPKLLRQRLGGLRQKVNRLIFITHRLYNPNKMLNRRALKFSYLLKRHFFRQLNVFM